MQIALVAVVLLAGMWFTVLKPKPAEETAASTPAPAASAPGTTGLSNAVDKAKAVSKTSDAANAKIQKATGAAATKAKATTTNVKATATKSTVTKSTAPKAATTKATTTSATAAKAKAVDVDPSSRLLAYLAKGKTLVVLFEGNGVDDQAARTAVHNTAKGDPKHVVSAYVPITKVGDYDALTSDIQIFQAPSILVIGADRKAKLLTGYVDTRSVQQAVGDARRDAAAAAK
jgi:hypothetical protein